MATTATVSRAPTGGGTGRTTRYSYNELAALWMRAGGDGWKAPLAAAIALAESGGDPNAIHTNTDGSTDRGLWQINSVHGALSVFDPLANAKAAVSISNNGKDFHPWATFQHGAYKKYMGGKDFDAGVGDYAHTAGATAQKVPGVSAVVDAASAVPNFLGKLGVLFERDFWQRVGYVSLGVICLTLGVWFIGRQFVAGQIANVVKSATKGG